MFSIEGLKRYIWYVNRVRYLKGFESHAKMNLAYFSSVRSHNMMRQKIGLQDFNVSKLPRANPKKNPTTMGNSETVLRRMLDDLPKEYEKLQRWRRIKKVSNKYPITGKVIFS